MPGCIRLERALSVLLICASPTAKAADDPNCRHVTAYLGPPIAWFPGSAPQVSVGAKGIGTCPSFPPVPGGCALIPDAPPAAFAACIQGMMSTIASMNKPKPCEQECGATLTTEICGNHIDDDGDGRIDEGCGYCNPALDPACCEMDQGCPVNVQTGHATTIPVVDFEVHGVARDDIIFTRIYDSGRAATGALGPGWIHSFESRVVESSGHVIWYREDGREVDFAPKPGGGWKRTAGRPFELTMGPYGYVVKDLITGETRSFDSQRRLYKRTTAAGKSVTLYHDSGSGELKSVANSKNQILYFDHTAGRLTQVRFADSPKTILVKFVYVAGRLDQVVYPTGEGYQHVYDPANGRLTSVLNGARLIERFTYADPQGRVSHVESEGTKLTFAYGYDCTLPSGSTDTDTIKGTRVLSGTGQESCIVFDEFNSLPVFVLGDNNQSHRKLSIFNADGNLQYSVDRANIQTTYEFDSEGRVIDERIGSTGKVRRVYQYPPCTGTGPCHLPNKIFEQGAQDDETLTCDPATAQGCAVTTITYDTTSWNVHTIQRSGNTSFIDGAPKPYCYIDTFNWNTAGQLISIRETEECPGNSTPYGIHFVYDSTSNRLASAVAGPWGIPAAQVVRATFGAYNAFGRPLSAILDGVTHTWYYDLSGRLSKVDVEGAAREYTWKEGRLAWIQHPLGNYDHFYYETNVSDFSDLKRITKTGQLPIGNSAPIGSEAIALSYLPSRLLNQVTYFRGVLDRSWSIKYKPSSDRVQAIQLAGVDVNSFDYDDPGRMTQSLAKYANDLQSDTTYGYESPIGLLTAVKKAVAANDPAKWGISRDSLGNITSLKDPHSRVTSYSYDDLNRITKVISPDSGTNRFEYDNKGRLWKRREGTGADQRTVTYQYDYLGRINTETAGVQQIVYHYDDPAVNAIGRLSRVDDPSGTTEFTYDKRGQLLSERRIPKSHPGSPIVIKYTNSPNGRSAVGTVQEETGPKRSWLFTEENENTGEAHDPDRPTSVSLFYTGLKVPKLLANNITWRSHLDQVQSFTYGNGLQSEFTYDTSGRIQGFGGTVVVHDDGGRPKKINQSNPAAPGRLYDAISYDPLDRVWKTTPQANPASSRPARTYSYDLTGNRDQITYAAGDASPTDQYYYGEAQQGCAKPADSSTSRLCKVVRGGAAGASATTSVAAAASANAAAKQKGNNGKKKWTATAINSDFQKLLAKLSSILRGAPSDRGTDGRLHAAEMVIRAFLKQHNITLSLFARVLLDNPKLRAKALAALAAKPGKQGDALLDLSTEARSLDVAKALDATSDIETHYSWDTAGRLVWEGPGANSTEFCYEYDAWGRLNRLAVTMQRPLGCVDSNLIDLDRYAYDYRGRRVSRTTAIYFYDQWNRLLAESEFPGKSALFLSRIYTYLGDRPLAHLDVADTIRVFDPGGCSVSQDRLPTALTALVFLGVPFCLVVCISASRRRRLLRAAGAFVAMIGLLALPTIFGECVVTTNPLDAPKIFYYHTDHLGTPIVLSDDTGTTVWQAIYDDFGAIVEETSDGPATRLRFPGQYDDKTKWAFGANGPYYNWNRYYDPDIGRYTQPDPIISNGIATVGNAYVYANNDPITGSDPEGLQDGPWDDPGFKLLMAERFQKVYSYDPAVEQQKAVQVMVASVAAVAIWYGGVGAVAAAARFGGLVNVARYGPIASSLAEFVNKLRDCRPQAPAASRILNFTMRALQKGFDKHGADFGLTGHWNPSRAAEYSRVVNQHINSPAVRIITGRYLGNPVTHYLNPQTGLNVVADPLGHYVTGFRLGPDQLHGVLTTGRLF